MEKRFHVTCEIKHSGLVLTSSVWAENEVSACNRAIDLHNRESCTATVLTARRLTKEEHVCAYGQHWQTVEF